MNSNDHYQSVFSSKLNSKSGRNQLHFFLSPLRCCSTKILHLKSKTLINYHVHTFDLECRVRKIRLMARNRNKILLYWSFIASSFIFFFTSGECQEIFYNGFKNAHNNITLNGIAEIESNGVLRLTNDTSRLLGHAFYPSKIRLKSSSDGKALSFSTNFAFGIVPQYAKLGGHGFAFAMVPDKECPGAQPSQYLGLLNSSDNGNFTNHIFAIEFDTVQDFAFGDINDNHVGVDIDSMTSNHSVPAGYFVDGNATVQNLTLQSGKAILVWIDYDSALNLLNVKLSPTNPKPKKNILSYEVDLSPYLNEYMYVGFSGSTGLLASSHYIIGWSFKVNGEATPLDLESLPSLPGPKKVNLGLVLGISIPVFLLMVFVSALIVYMIWKYRNRDVIESWELEVGPHRFPYEELKRATKGFSNKELLGFGGFGKVYKGTLPKCNIEIAVKRISRGSNQGLQEFLSEIASIGKLRHRNLVQLLGWCRRRSDFMLVYEFMPSGSLDKHLFVDQPKAVLNWKQRCNIIKGAAAGLLYLHEGWEQTVIHRDIKSGNVLLDDQLNAKLGDFGLAKLYEHGSSPSTTRVVGTMGYLATEMTRTGKPTTSSDVFAFGALLLEVVCGRRPIEPQALPEDLILVDLVWDKWRDSTILDVVDPKLDGDFEEVEAVLLLKLGLLCSVDDPSSRPTMRQVVRYLEGEVELPDSVAPPSGYNGKKGGARGGGGFEDYAHSYRSSSCFELSTWSMNVERDGDLEVGSTSLSLSTSGER